MQTDSEEGGAYDEPAWPRRFARRRKRRVPPMPPTPPRLPPPPTPPTLPTPPSSAVQPAPLKTTFETSVGGVNVTILTSLTEVSEPTNGSQTEALDNQVVRGRRAKRSNRSHEPAPEEPQEKRRKPELGCCPICLEELGMNPMASTKCGHIFCYDCIKLSMSKSSKCPTCRKRLRRPSAYHPIFY